MSNTFDVFIDKVLGLLYSGGMEKKPKFIQIPMDKLSEEARERLLRMVVEEKRSVASTCALLIERALKNESKHNPVGS